MSAVPFAVGELVTPANFLNRAPQELATLDLSSSTTFSSIQQDFRDLVITFAARSDTAAQTAGVTLRVNGSSSAAYHHQSRRLTNTTENPAASTGDTSARLGRITAASATSGLFGHGTVWIPNYASTSMRIVGRSTTSALPSASATTDWALDEFGWLFNSAAAVSSVQLLTTGSFVSGSTATLFGLGQV